MLGSPQLLDTLRGIGLNLYERKLWLALLAKGVGTAGELSTIANVPRSRTYDVMQSLAEKGFVVVQTSKPLKYVASPPEEALEKAKQRLRVDLESKIERIDRLSGSTLLDELKNIHQQGLKLVAPEDITGALKGKQSILQQMDTMYKGASSSVNIVTTATGLNELVENHFSILKGLKQKGVKVRIATKTDDSNVEAIKALSNVAEVRKIQEKELALHGKFSVVDNQQLMIGLSNPESSDAEHMIFWTKSPHASGNLATPLFDLVWEKAVPLGKK